jgi:hypothetical protein
MAYSRQRVRAGAFHSDYWDIGVFTSYIGKATYQDKSSPLRNWEIRVEGRAVSGSADNRGIMDALIAAGTAKLNLRFASSGWIRLRGWAGKVISGYDRLPRQHRFWLSGGIDPDARSILGVNRSGSGPLRMYDHLIIPDQGPGMRVLNKAVPGLTAWAVNLDIESNLPLVLFADVAVTRGTTYVDFGAVLELGPLNLILPIWNNWTAGQNISYLQQIRVGISLPVIDL